MIVVIIQSEMMKLHKISFGKAAFSVPGYNNPKKVKLTIEFDEPMIRYIHLTYVPLPLQPFQTWILL